MCVLQRAEEWRLLVASKDKKQVRELKIFLGSKFEIKDLGDAKKILGMEIVRDRDKGTLSVSQEGYLLKVLGRFNMDQSKPVATFLRVHFQLKATTKQELHEQFDFMKNISYQSAVGSLMYSMIGTHPDLLIQ